ncbi:crossover junction endodeoxyribonuclease RuvC [Fibrobacterales bacterium]|nr:crossover junction endodeoxyribonuclease RuvC [Fibrobacterales bacterium]
MSNLGNGSGGRVCMLGIDPGSYATGYAFLTATGNRAGLLDYGVLRAKKDDELIFRIGHIIGELEILIEKFKPQALCMEETFFAKNARTALILGHIRGAIMSLAYKCDLVFSEKSPRKVKQSVTGNGAASKEQVANMMGRLLGVNVGKETALDSTDALAVAWAGLFG